MAYGLKRITGAGLGVNALKALSPQPVFVPCFAFLRRGGLPFKGPCEQKWGSPPPVPPRHEMPDMWGSTHGKK